jgi:cytochrome c-type biogenesis protein CcmH
MVKRALSGFGTAVTILAAAVIIVGLVIGDDEEADRAQRLAQGLRCPVCTSESVADSDSRTAIEMRALIDEQIADGKGDDEIVDFFVGAYGDWIVTDPPPRGRTLLLWALPIAALGIGIAVILTRLRGRPAAPEPTSTPRERGT